MLSVTWYWAVLRRQKYEIETKANLARQDKGLQLCLARIRLAFMWYNPGPFPEGMSKKFEIF